MENKVHVPNHQLDILSIHHDYPSGHIYQFIISWLIGFPTMGYHNPQETGKYNPYSNQLTSVFLMALNSYIWDYNEL